MIERAVAGLNRIGLFAAEVALLALMVITVYAVIARYVFNSPSANAMEVSVYLLLISTWGAVGWIHRLDRHVCMEAFSAKLTGIWKLVSRVVSQLSILAFCAMLVWAGYGSALEKFEKNYRSTSLLEFPLWMPFALIPIGGLLLGAMALVRLKRAEPEA